MPLGRKELKIQPLYIPARACRFPRGIAHSVAVKQCVAPPDDPVLHATSTAPPGRHRHRYRGVLAPNAALRRAVTARAGQPIASTAVPRYPTSAGEPVRLSRRPASYVWAA